MKHSSRFFLILSTFFIYFGCSTPQSQALRKVEVGMDKSDVLEIMGNPSRKTREHGLDRWTYEIRPIHTEDKLGPEKTYIFFSEGKVSYVGPAENPQPAAKPQTPTPPAGSFKPVQ